MPHGSSRLDAAMPVDTPTHDHHPTGRCKDCILWVHTHANLGLCINTYEETDTDWSCVLFTPTQPFL